MPQRGIFLSYRREDSGGYARLLYEGLSARFPDRVFLDVAEIEADADFVAAIEKPMESSGVCIALIGRQWVS